MHRSTPVWLTLLAAVGALSFSISQSAQSQVNQPAANGSALRFFGTGAPDLDRVKIALNNGAGSRPVNLAEDFTIEFWLKARSIDNSSEPCDPGRGWYYGSVIVDRDVFGEDDAYGDYGLALMGGRIIVGVNTAAGETQLCSSVAVADNQWQHIAFTRNASTGVMRLFINGAPAGEADGPTGRLDYQIGRATDYPNSDPFLVLGAEKHDFPGSLYYNGLLDDLRFSNTVRYSAAFTRPTAPHAADAATVALYRFDEGAGTQIADSAGAAGGPSNGVLTPRNGANAAEHWSADTPFGSAPPTHTPSPTSTASPLPTEAPNPTAVPPPTASPTPKPMCTAPATSTVPTVAGTPTPPKAPSPTAPVTPAAATYRVFLPLIRCP